MQWLWIGLAIMLVLIGSSVFVSVVFLNGSTALSNSGAVWGFVGLAIGFFFLIFSIFGWACSPTTADAGDEDTGDIMGLMTTMLSRF